MSYTINSTPAALSSLHGDLVFTVAYPEHTSDPITYPNYKFVADVYVGTTQVARLKKVPHPVTKIGIFNIAQVVRNYIAVAFNPSASSFLAQQLTIGEYGLNVTVKFGEEYAYDTYTNLVVDTERTFYNNYNGRLTGTATSLIGYSNKVVSNRPLNTPIDCGASFCFIPYFGTTAGTVNVEVKTYDGSGTLTDTEVLILTVSLANNLCVVNCSKDGINALQPGLINATTKYYTVQFGTGNVYRFNIDCECRYEVFTLHFLNKFGGFESKDFAKVSRRTVQIEKKDFGKLPYTVDAAGAVSYYNANNVYNETRSVYASQFSEKLLLNSDLLTDGEYRWLEELILSPMVYLQSGEYFFPIIISDSNYEAKKLVNDGFTNLTISVEYGEQLNTQFR